MHDILKVYPQKNLVWKKGGESDFFADASDFQVPPGVTPNPLDPWNRKFPNPAQLGYAEGEVVAWTFRTTVTGQPIVCTIFND